MMLDTFIIETDQGYLECPAAFTVDSETYPAEPYTWGGSRGNETSASVTLVSVTLGGATLLRAAVVGILGETAVAAQEDRIAEEMAEEAAA